MSGCVLSINLSKELTFYRTRVSVSKNKGFPGQIARVVEVAEEVVLVQEAALSSLRRHTRCYQRRSAVTCEKVNMKTITPD